MYSDRNPAYWNIAIDKNASKKRTVIDYPFIKAYRMEGFELTGRMKDFYDIYYLARMFDFEGAKLQAAIFRTLQQRGTVYDRDSFK